MEGQDAYIEMTREIEETEESVSSSYKADLDITEDDKSTWYFRAEKRHGNYFLRMSACKDGGFVNVEPYYIRLFFRCDDVKKVEEEKPLTIDEAVDKGDWGCQEKSVRDLVAAIKRELEE